jgi:hypothetical protein
MGASVSHFEGIVKMVGPGKVENMSKSEDSPICSLAMPTRSFSAVVFE